MLEGPHLAFWRELALLQFDALFLYYIGFNPIIMNGGGFVDFSGPWPSLDPSAIFGEPP